MFYSKISTYIVILLLVREMGNDTLLRQGNCNFFKAMTHLIGEFYVFDDQSTLGIACHKVGIISKIHNNGLDGVLTIKC